MTKNLEELAAIAIDCGLRIHRDLGPGLLESVYETVLAASLTKAGLRVARQKPISFVFDEISFNDVCRIDLLFEDRLIIEVKSTEIMAKVHGKQLLTYLRLTQQPLGLLMNFGGATFKEGLRRIVNEHTSFASSRLRVHNRVSERGNREHILDEFFNRPGVPDFTEPQDSWEMPEHFDGSPAQSRT
jgi:GxxExxY protein